MRSDLRVLFGIDVASPRTIPASASRMWGSWLVDLRPISRWSVLYVTVASGA